MAGSEARNNAVRLLDRDQSFLVGCKSTGMEDSAPWKPLTTVIVGP